MFGSLNILFHWLTGRTIDLAVTTCKGEHQCFLLKYVTVLRTPKKTPIFKTFCVSLLELAVVLHESRLNRRGLWALQFWVIFEQYIMPRVKQTQKNTDSKNGTVKSAVRWITLKLQQMIAEQNSSFLSEINGLQWKKKKKKSSFIS